MAANGVGKLCFIDGIMTAHTYIDMLRHNLQSSAQKLGLGTSFVFQQDNDPKHTANLTRELLLYTVAHAGIFRGSGVESSQFLYDAPFDFVDFREQNTLKELIIE
ncbi:hypothetical protein TNCV_542621 [Trichonephila clavipes]|nr:hypothetical protein TNCV_542621 [Trichonephila clavipes]